MHSDRRATWTGVVTRLPLRPSIFARHAEPRSWLTRVQIVPTLAVLFCGTVTFSSLITGFFVGQSTVAALHLQTSERLKDASRLLASQLDADQLATLRDPSQTRSAEYDRAHAVLVRALRHIEGVRFIYTLRKNSSPPKDDFSRYVFLVDGLPYAHKDFAPIGEILTTTDTTDAMHRVWKTGRFEVDREFVKDEWGVYLSGYLPLLKKDGSFESVLGIDISAEHLINERQNTLFRLLQAFVISLLVILPCAYLIGRKLGSPLRDINCQLNSLAKLDFDRSNREISSSRFIDEIYQISRSLVVLRSALADFSRYVPTSLVRQIVLEPDSINLEGESRELAILFTDIRGFTTLSENLDPAFILQLLNEYYGVINQVATQTRGVLDKYIGDSALLFWGAPEQLADPVRAALDAALLCKQNLIKLNTEWISKGIEVQFDTCFGLDYGPVVIGNMGPYERVNYTIVGDHVNQAQRIEHSNRRYGTSILASHSIISGSPGIKRDYLIQSVGGVHLPGLSGSVELFEIIALRASASEDEVRFVDFMSQAQSAYDAGDMPLALELLGQIPRCMSERAYVQSLIKACRSDLLERDL
ncbi:MAG: adenylate/guanylate cyclase domain-containing protein [Burkholderiaceae bacterium]